MHIMCRVFATITVIVMLFSGGGARAQFGAADREDVIRITSEWTGERFHDGRPKVPDDILRRMSAVTIEEAWGVIRGKGYRLQFAGDWYTLHPERVVVGRAVTAAFIPQRPDLHEATVQYGKEHGLSQSGGQNSWVIDVLVPGDVVVVDLFGKVVDGSFAGGNLANAIKAKTDIDGFITGMVIEGGIRDLDQIYAIDDFNTYVCGVDPTGIGGVTLAGLNVPVRISGATCLPGDIVLGGREGVIFIPPHLAEAVVESSERVRLRDIFGFERLREGRYTPGEIDSRWTEEIDADFTDWLEKNVNDLPVSTNTVKKIIEERRSADR